MHIIWWVLVIIFVISAFVGLVRLINHQLYKKSSSILTLVISVIGIFIFYSLVTHSQGATNANRHLTPDQKVDQDLENIVVENVLVLKSPKFSHLTFKNDTDNGNYTVGGVVSGIDQSGKKVEYDFSAYTDGSNTIQWSTENTSTYDTETGTVDTSTGLVKTMSKK